MENILLDVAKRLNAAGIDYYIVGAVGAYLEAGIPFPREHDDLDIFINEADVPKLAEVFQGTNFDFCDHRGTSAKTLNTAGYTDGEHEVIAKYRGTDFHIGFFLFRRNEEIYTVIEYYRDGNTQKKLERTLPIRYFDLQYNTKPILFHGVPMKTVRKETIYKNKTVMERKKDQFDREQLAPKVDAQIIEQLAGMHQYRVIRTSEID